MNEHLTRFDSPIPLTLGRKVGPDSRVQKLRERAAELKPAGPEAVRFVESEAVTVGDAVARPKTVVFRRWLPVKHPNGEVGVTHVDEVKLASAISYPNTWGVWEPAERLMKAKDKAMENAFERAFNDVRGKR